MVETAAANPELLADQVANLLVAPLEAASVVLSSGVRIFDTAGVLRIPKLTGSSAVGFVAESQDPVDHDTTFDELVLMPTDRKSLKTIERYTNVLVRQSVIGIDAVLKNRLVKVVGDKLDTELLVGTGASAGMSPTAVHNSRSSPKRSETFECTRQPVLHNMVRGAIRIAVRSGLSSGRASAIWRARSN